MLFRSKNQAAPVTRTIEVVDLVAPVIVLNGASSVSHQVGSAYTDAGSTVTDNIDDDLSATVAGTVDVSTLGTYTLSFSATDSSGNKAATVTRTVTVVDSAPPLITLLGDADMTIAQGSTFTDPGATAEDAQDGAVDVVVIGEVDSSTAGTYTLTYTASDGQGNQADPVTRTVNVEVVDNDPPVIALVGDASMSIDLGSTFTEPGVSATDTVDGEVAVTTSGTVNTSIAGSYTLTYTAKDAAGNAATPVSRLVTVVDTDTTAPVITLLGDEDVSHQLGEDYEDAGATAEDEIGRAHV